MLVLMLSFHFRVPHGRMGEVLKLINLLNGVSSIYEILGLANAAIPYHCDRVCFFPEGDPF